MNDSPASSRAPEVGRREHAGVGDHDHVGDAVALLEGGDDWDQRLRLGLVAFEHVNIQREPVPGHQ